jgi:hypothetical protein
MHRVQLVHWNEAEGKEQAKRLAAAGYAVEFTPLNTPASRRAFRANPPTAFVIDLSRLPSHGREVALSLRQYKPTRHVPLVFVEGDPEKIARIQQVLPDAVYTNWRRIRGALKSAIANPPKQPRVPSSVLEGYSGTPLPKKLGIKDDSIVLLEMAPPDFEQTLGALPAGVTLIRKFREDVDSILWFVRSRRELESRLTDIAGKVDGRSLWIIWPKKTSALASDVSEPIVREKGLASGLVDYKVCAVDATWSGLKFARKKLK